MEIVIGAAPRVGPPPKRTPTAGGGFVEAKILNVRQPRRRRENRSGQGDRRQRDAQDPVGGRVMVLLIPEGYNIPTDITSGDYRIFLRFVPHKK